MERSNANLVGGDISAGAPTLARLANPLRYRTPLAWLYICSAATARGPGVHGMCGHHAARAALSRADPSFEG
jgi:phytoene dehydrogenase-like protein